MSTPASPAQRYAASRRQAADGRELTAFQALYDFSFDSFQKQACKALSDGHGVLTARHPGGYILVITADDYQPGAITVAVADGPVDAEIPLTRSASLAGTVGGEDGPVVGAQLALVQDGAIVDTAKSGPDGTYRFRDLSLGEYGLSVSAHEREPAALVVEIADEADLWQDVVLPSGISSADVIVGPG